jgi:hypothetical protein
MTVISLLIWPQASLTAPYEALFPSGRPRFVSAYLRVSNASTASEDLSGLAGSGVDGVLLAPNLTTLGPPELDSLLAEAESLGLSAGLSLGGELASPEPYMSQGYKSDLLSSVQDLESAGALSRARVVELLPWINCPTSSALPSDLQNLLFGPLRDDVAFLSELAGEAESSGARLRTSLQVSYSPSFRPALRWIGEISALDEVGVCLFQPHINAMPACISSVVPLVRHLTGKEVLVGPLGFSSHDDLHTPAMQASWLWSCLGAASSAGVGEASVWEWSGDPGLPFSVQENLPGRYALSGSIAAESLPQTTLGPAPAFGYLLNLAELALGTFSSSGSTGVVTGNLMLSLVFRVLLAVLLARRWRINGGLLANLVFAGALLLHFSTGVPILNSPSWWLSLPTYAYAYASISAGAYQMQAITVVARGRRDLAEGGACSLD